MADWLLWTQAASGVIIAGLALRVLSLEARRRGRPLWASRHIPTVAPDEIDPSLRADVGEPMLTASIAVTRAFGGISDLEAWVLCAHARRARAIFEFGTCTGKTTWLLARNSPGGATVWTLTLAPTQVAEYKGESGDSSRDARAALRESTQTAMVYENSPEAGKVRQLYADSKTFDESALVGTCDLVFVDGSHARSYVESDTRKALRMARPGGLVFWHDYRGPTRAPGVFHTLNRLARTMPLRHVRGTSLVVWQAPFAPHS